MTTESLFTTELPDSGKGDESDGGPGLTCAHVMYATVPGTITGIRWYSSITAPPSPPTLELWSPTSTTTGPRLASKVYTGSHVGGTWLQQLFDTPVSMPAFTYFCPGRCQDDRYVFRAGTFTAPITNGHLVGIQSGTDPLGVGYTLGNEKLAFGGPNKFPDFDPTGAPGCLVDVLFVPDSGTTVDGSTTVALGGLAVTAAGHVTVHGTASVDLGGLNLSAAVIASGAAARIVSASRSGRYTSRTPGGRL